MSKKVWFVIWQNYERNYLDYNFPNTCFHVYINQIHHVCLFNSTPAPGGTLCLSGSTRSGFKEINHTIY